MKYILIWLSLFMFSCEKHNNDVIHEYEETVYKRKSYITISSVEISSSKSSIHAYGVGLFYLNNKVYSVNLSGNLYGYHREDVIVSDIEIIKRTIVRRYDSEIIYEPLTVNVY